MIPEEFDRTMEFILQSQARLAAAQEHDREHRARFEEWSGNVTGQIVQLLEHQSRRMDLQSRRMDLLEEEARTRHREWREVIRVMQKQHGDVMEKLDRILDRLTGKPN
jgi:hypothetical protein